MWGAASILFCCARRSRTLVLARGSRSSRCSPHRIAVPAGGGGVPSAPGRRRAAPVAPQLGGVRGGGGGLPPRPLPGLSGRGGESGGGPLVPWRRLLKAGWGGGMAVPAPGASHRLWGRALPPPPST